MNAKHVTESHRKFHMFFQLYLLCFSCHRIKILSLVVFSHRIFLHGWSDIVTCEKLESKPWDYFDADRIKSNKNMINMFLTKSRQNLSSNQITRINEYHAITNCKVEPQFGTHVKYRRPIEKENGKYKIYITLTRLVKFDCRNI